MDGRVLIIDASSYERQKIRHILEKNDSYEICEVQSLRQFKPLVDESGGFDLVIMDIEFPTEAGGFEVLETLRENDSLKETSVIIVTKLDKPEIKAEALKYSVGDFIVKPYQIKRLESSIKSALKKVDNFHYDTSAISEIRMTFDQYVSREIKYSKRMHSPLSFILITTLNLKGAESGDNPSSGTKETIYSIAAEKAKASLRITDTIVTNKQRDVLIVLPNTDTAGAAQVCDKIKTGLFAELGKLHTDKSEYPYPVHVTCPENGEDFQTLMKNAFKKISDKEMLEKIVSIPANKLQYADRSYSRYRRWF